MTQRRQSFAVGEMAMPLMETPEQQRIMDLEEQLEQEKKDHQKTKSQLEDAEIKLSDRASEVERLKNTIQCLVVRNQASYEKIQKSDNDEAKNELKFQMLKSELEKVNMKFDDLKEQISKGQMQEELEKLKETNKNLESENSRLQEELSESTRTTKELQEKIEKFEKTDVELKCRNADLYKKITEIIADNGRYKEHIEELEKNNFRKDKIIQGLEETIRQNECKLDVLEEKDLKYDEAIMKLNGMDKLQKAMKDLELKHSQLQQQQQEQEKQLQQSYSKELKECLSLQKKALDAGFENDNIMYFKWYNEYRRCGDDLSVEDRKICNQMWRKYGEDLRKKKKNSQ